MYITANLPPFYGRFNQIRRDNYPFRNIFGTYLEAICTLGLSLQVDADLLVGIIEDTLLPDMRLPDIPEGDELVKFRFTLENETVKTYFAGSELSNKTIIMLVIRMTLRLSERFGTSLSRLTRLITSIPAEGAPDARPVVEQLPKPETPKLALRITKKRETALPGTAEREESKREPKLEPALSGTAEREPEKDPGDVIKRLEELTEKGDQLIAEGAAPTVVETNPYLVDFL